MNMFAKTVRSLVALVVLCLGLLVSSGSAFAEAPQQQYRSIGVNEFPTLPWVTVAQTACNNYVDAYNTKNSKTFTATVHTAQNCRIWNGAAAQFDSPLSTRSWCSSGAAPDTAKPLAEQCTPPVNNCPEAGTSAGIQNITTAWSNGPSLDSKIQLKIVPDGGLGNAGSVSYCVSSCGIANSGAAPTGCWQSSIPSNTGLHRISCDVPMINTGQPCTVGTGSGQSPDPTVPPPAPACAGAFGTVNGKPTCLDSSGSTPNTTTPAPNPGNPAPGTIGGGDKSTGVDPGTGAGTGTNGTGTGGAGSGGGSGGGGTNVTVDVTDIATCGLPGKPKCQIDEAGTPENGDSVFTTAKTGLDTAVTAHKDAMAGVVGDADKDASWGWFPSLPTGDCTPFQMGSLPPINWCPIVPTLKDIAAWCWGIVSLFLILGMTQRAIRGN